MPRNTGERHEGVALDIRRQFGERSMARFLNALPAFKVADDMPGHLTALLDKLDEAESRTDAKVTSR
jgi:hypothetical protein